jgi:hypothetical protein
VPTNPSGQFPILLQRDRDIGIAATTGVSTASIIAYSGFSVSTVIPKNALTVSGALSVTNSGATGPVTLSISIFDGAQGIGTQTAVVTGQSGSSGGAAPFNRSKIVTAQDIFISTTTSGSGGGSPTFAVTISGYSI